MRRVSESDDLLALSEFSNAFLDFGDVCEAIGGYLH